jgi:hypothetical protein
MGMNMQTIARGGGDVRAVGLCHSVQGTLDQIMGYIGEDPKQVTFTCAGINHMAFYTRLEKEGVDLYPRLFEAMEKPEIYKTNKVRFELMKRLGYFVTESSEHNAEYSPFFIPHGSEITRKYDVPIDEYLRRCDGNVDEFARLKASCAGGEPMAYQRSHEYGSTIIHSVVTGTPSVVYGNAPNRGSISNLPESAIAEVATVVDRSGLRPTVVGELPPQLIGYMQPHVTQQELFIRAALEGRRDHVYQAAMFDPLTAATLTLDQIVEMCDELIAAHGALLPMLDGKKTLVAGSGKTFLPVEAKALRASWEAAQGDAGEEIVREWHVIGPFVGNEAGKISLNLETAMERDFVARGSVDLGARYGRLSWKRVTAHRRSGLVDLGRDLARAEFCVAYGYAEVESPRCCETTLRCGSDDGIRIWVNGEVVHSHEIGRGYQAGSDEVRVRLREGVNQLLVKVDNYEGDWGFGVRIGV